MFSTEQARSTSPNTDPSQCPEAALTEVRAEESTTMAAATTATHMHTEDADGATLDQVLNPASPNADRLGSVGVCVCVCVCVCARARVCVRSLEPCVAKY